MEKREIIDYILNTSENTNTNILKNMMDQMLPKSKVYEFEVVRGSGTTGQFTIPNELVETYWSYPFGCQLYAKCTFQQNNETKKMFLPVDQLYVTEDEEFVSLYGLDYTELGPYA